MKKILFILFLSIGFSIDSSQSRLIEMEKPINRLHLQKPLELEGYTVLRYDNFTVDPSSAEFVELWNNPKIIADAGHFMVVPDNQIWTLRDDCKPKKIACCIRFGVVDSCGHIDQLATHPDDRGKGLAKKLMSEAEYFCATHGCSSLKLSVYRDNLVAISVYEKMGFSKCD